LLALSIHCKAIETIFSTIKGVKMSKQKSILVATIGTRDLAFRVSSQEWLNLGNSHVADSDSISEQAMIQMELNLEKSDFRFLTEYLNESFSNYQEQLKPIILGNLINDQAKDLKKIYLVGTNQYESVKYRDKDTLYSAEIIKKWIDINYQIPTEVILQGPEGKNPADFEAMFNWWKQSWKYIAQDLPENTQVLLSVKGGVGAFSEAARITALSLFGEDVLFFDFLKNDAGNLQGIPSDYTNPFRGTNYLWDRKQKEALSLLDRHDYEAVNKILLPYYRAFERNQSTNDLITRIEVLLEAAINWNRADFKNFAKIVGDSAKTRSSQWWWIGYEAAYLGIVRFHQGNTVEAMFHTFRAVEGLICEWAIYSYPTYINRDNYGTNRFKAPTVRKDIYNAPGMAKYLNQFTVKGQNELPLYSDNLDNLLKIAKPQANQNRDMLAFWDVAKVWRNQLFHRLVALQKDEVFKAWNRDNKEQWELRVLNCLNFLSEQQFKNLKSASLMSAVHNELKEAIATYQP
jgi:hypothetical protein